MLQQMGIDLENHKWLKVTANALVLVAMILGLSLSPFVADTAQACSTVAAYADKHNNKPALYVYSPGKDTSIRVAYQNWKNSWERVPHGEHSIKQDLPQNRSGDWAVYYIGTTWRLSQPYTHMFWNDDWRWGVQRC